jgi:hypothetical protein
LLELPGRVPGRAARRRASVSQSFVAPVDGACLQALFAVRILGKMGRARWGHSDRGCILAERGLAGKAPGRCGAGDAERQDASGL